MRRYKPRIDLNQCCACHATRLYGMEWQVHYQHGDQQFRASAVDRSTAIAIACILLRDGHEVPELVSTAGETIEADEIKRLCER